MKVIFSILYLIFYISSLLAQNITLSQYRGELNIKLDIIDDKRLEKGVEILNSAATVENEALALLNTMDDEEKIEGISSNYKKMLKSFIEASDLYQEGHSLIYLVYDENCIKFLEEMKKRNKKN